MKNRSQWFLLFILVLLSGCAHVISKDLRTKSDPSLALSLVRQNPDASKGKMVVWGGEIVRLINQKDETTLIEVFQRPLNWRGEPDLTKPSDGRFLILVEKYLDAYVFWKGRQITVAGEIQGEKVRPLDEMDYRYPLILSKQIHLWRPYYTSSYYSPYPYYDYNPWGWGYPYWRWGFGFHYYYFPHHRHHR